MGSANHRESYGKTGTTASDDGTFRVDSSVGGEYTFSAGSERYSQVYGGTRSYHDGQTEGPNGKSHSHAESGSNDAHFNVRGSVNGGSGAGLVRENYFQDLDSSDQFRNQSSYADRPDNTLIASSSSGGNSGVITASFGIQATDPTVSIVSSPAPGVTHTSLTTKTHSRGGTSTVQYSNQSSTASNANGSTATTKHAHTGTDTAYWNEQTNEWVKEFAIDADAGYSRLSEGQVRDSVRGSSSDQYSSSTSNTTVVPNVGTPTQTSISSHTDSGNDSTVSDHWVSTIEDELTIDPSLSSVSSSTITETESRTDTSLDEYSDDDAGHVDSAGSSSSHNVSKTHAETILESSTSQGTNSSSESTTEEGSDSSSRTFADLQISSDVVGKESLTTLVSSAAGTTSTSFQSDGGTHSAWFTHQETNSEIATLSDGETHSSTSSVSDQESSTDLYTHQLSVVESTAAGVTDTTSDFDSGSDELSSLHQESDSESSATTDGETESSSTSKLLLESTSHGYNNDNYTTENVNNGVNVLTSTANHSSSDSESISMQTASTESSSWSNGAWELLNESSNEQKVSDEQENDQTVTVINGTTTVMTATSSESGSESESDGTGWTESAVTSLSSGLIETSSESHAEQHSSSEIGTDQILTTTTIIETGSIQTRTEIGSESHSDSESSSESTTAAESVSFSDGTYATGSEATSVVETSTDNGSNEFITTAVIEGGSTISFSSTESDSDCGSTTTSHHDENSDSSSGLSTDMILTESNDYGSIKHFDNESETTIDEDGAWRSTDETSVSTVREMEWLSSIEIGAFTATVPTATGSESISETFTFTESSNSALSTTTTLVHSDENGVVTDQKLEIEDESGEVDKLRTASGTITFDGFDVAGSDYGGSGIFSETDSDSDSFTQSSRLSTRTDPDGALTGANMMSMDESHSWMKMRDDTIAVTADGNDAGTVTLSALDSGQADTQESDRIRDVHGGANDQDNVTIHTVETATLSESDAESSYLEETTEDFTSITRSDSERGIVISQDVGAPLTIQTGTQTYPFVVAAAADTLITGSRAGVIEPDGSGGAGLAAPHGSNFESQTGFGGAEEFAAMDAPAGDSGSPVRPRPTEDPEVVQRRNERLAREAAKFSVIGPNRGMTEEEYIINAGKMGVDRVNYMEEEGASAAQVEEMANALAPDPEEPKVHYYTLGSPDPLVSSMKAAEIVAARAEPVFAVVGLVVDSAGMVTGALLLAAPEPTAGTKVAGAALYLLSVDGMRANLSTLLGEPSPSLLRAGSEKLGETIGMNPDSGETALFASEVEFFASMGLLTLQSPKPGVFVSSNNSLYGSIKDGDIFAQLKFGGRRLNSDQLTDLTVALDDLYRSKNMTFEGFFTGKRKSRFIPRKDSSGRIIGGRIQLVGTEESQPAIRLVDETSHAIDVTEPWWPAREKRLLSLDDFPSAREEESRIFGHYQLFRRAAKRLEAGDKIMQLILKPEDAKLLRQMADEINK